MRTFLPIILLALSACDDAEQTASGPLNVRDGYHLSADAWEVVPEERFAGYDKDWSTLIDDGKQLGCLARNIYHEARGESLKGQIAVAHVTLNRVRSKRYPDTVCDVVYQSRQFSWTHQNVREADTESREWQIAKEVAQRVMDGRVSDPTHGSMWYFAPAKANPAWAKAAYDVADIGNHRFMKLNGGM